MNRLEDLFRDPPEPEREDDFWEVDGYGWCFTVSLETAIEIERRLDQRPPPRWIVFRDLTGARHRIVAANIYRISECTAAQRAAGREFDRARRLEDRQDRRPWEDD